MSGFFNRLPLLYDYKMVCTKTVTAQLYMQVLLTVTPDNAFLKDHLDMIDRLMSLLNT